MARTLWVKLDCLNPNLDLVKVTTHRKNAWKRCCVLHRYERWTDALPEHKRPPTRWGQEM